MEGLVTVDEFAKWRYRTDKPTKAQVNTVARMCRDGSLSRYSKKLGRRWYIDMDKWRKE